MLETILFIGSYMGYSYLIHIVGDTEEKKKGDYND